MDMFKRMLGVFVIAVLAVGFANPARADDDQAKAKKKKTALAVGSAAAFNKLDTNKDGKLDQDEFNKLSTVMTVPKGKKGAAFDLTPVFKKLDTNNDGKLTPDEFAKIADALPQKKKKN
jgi:hypothetical protein